MGKKKKLRTTWESWLRCQMLSGLENDVINTRGIGHILYLYFVCILYCCSSSPLMFCCLFTADWKAPLHLNWQLTHWSSHKKVRCHLQENFIWFHQPSPHFAGNSFNTLSRGKKSLLIISTQSFGVKMLEFMRSLNPDFASLSLIHHSSLQTGIHWATITSITWLILVFKYLSSIVESKR